MKYLYYGVFFLAILILASFNVRLLNEIVYNVKKSKRSSNAKLKVLAKRLLKRELKISVLLIWIAFETYLKGKRPNTYSMGSWLFNIKLVQGKEIIVLSLISLLFIVAICQAYFSKERLIKAVSIDKRTILKKRVKSWDETKLTNDEKKELIARFAGANS